MAAEQATVALAELPFQIVQEPEPPLQIKTEEEDEEEEEEEEGRGAKGPRVIQAGRLSDILARVGPSEKVKQELGGTAVQGWEEQRHEHPALLQALPPGWEIPPQADRDRARPQDALKREQPMPVLFEEMGVDSPEPEQALPGRRQPLHREAKQRSERSFDNQSGPWSRKAAAGSLAPIPSFTKTSRRGTNWSYSEILDLLDIWGEQGVQQVLQSSHRNMDTFQAIASEMAKRGHERTAPECRTKTKTLRRDFKKVKESHPAGRRQSVCPFYDQLERILESAARMQTAAALQQQEESGGDEPPLWACKEGSPPERLPGPEEAPEPFEAPLDCGDPVTVVCKLEEEADEPRGTPVPVVEPDLPPNPLLLAPQSTPGSPATTGSTAEVHVTPCQSPLPGPTGLTAAERLINLRNRHKKTRTDLAVELARAADRRMQEATDRILSALDDYAKADLEDREKERLSTEQIIAIMQRQTELLETLVRQQASVPAAAPQASSRHGWPPRNGPPSHRPMGISAARLAVSRRPLAPRARNRRRPQNYSP